MKIIALNLSKLINAKHINFMLFVKNGLNLYEVVGERFATVVASFLSAYAEENEVFLKHQRKFLTDEIGLADTRRDTAFRRFRDVIKTFLLGQNEEKKAAAQKMLDVIDLYGGTNIPGLAVDAESGILSNLVEDFETEYQDLVTLLGVDLLLADLKAANGEFLSLMSDRTLHFAEYGKAAVAKARQRTDVAYRNLVSAVNIAVDNGMASLLAPFVHYMNAEIERYRIQLGQGTGSGSGSGSDSEDGETEVLYATATFHFADHTEEDLRQPVGSLLVAPENTEGYVWEPAVPELMPAEDTAYYEMPIAAEEENPDEPNEGGDEPGEGDDSNEGGDDTPKPVATVVFRNKDFQTIYTLTRKAGEEISAEDWPSPEEEGYRWNMTRSKVNDIIANLTTDTTITVQAVS